MASLWRAYKNRSVLRVCCFYMRQICASAEAESKNEKMTKGMKRRLRAEGIRAHALYNIKVNEIAANLRATRLNEEKSQMASKVGFERPEQLEKEENERIIQSVKLENEKMEELRNERKMKEMKMRQEEVAKQIERRNLKREELRMSRRQHVLRAIEESKTWVNRENLEAKIAHCLENETNYNFALSPSGEKYYSDTPPGYVSTEGGPGRAAYIKNKDRSDIKPASKRLL